MWCATSGPSCASHVRSEGDLLLSGIAYPRVSRFVQYACKMQHAPKVDAHCITAISILAFCLLQGQLGWSHSALVAGAMDIGAAVTIFHSLTQPACNTKFVLVPELFCPRHAALCVS